MKNGPSTSSGRAGTTVAALLFGGLFAGAFFIGLGPDKRSPIVWNGQTDVDEESIVNCLKRVAAFESVVYVSASARASADTRAYYLGSDISLHFGDFFQDPDRVVVRGKRELTRAEAQGLKDCKLSSAVDD